MRRAIRGIGLLVAAVVLLWTTAAVVPLRAEETTAAPTLTVSDLAWLAGQWQGELNGALIEEHWSTPAGGVIMGMFRWVKPAEEGAREGANRIALYELFVLEPDDEGQPVLRLRHFSPGLVAWEEKDAPMELRLVEAGPNRALFQKQGGDEAVRLEYSRPEPDELLAILVDGGKRTEFQYRQARR